MAATASSSSKFLYCHKRHSSRLPTLTTMATKNLKKATESLYHLSPKGFWKKFREYSGYIIPFILLNCMPGDVVSANPTISSGLPIPNENRYPPPASRPEMYLTPATKGLYMPFANRLNLIQRFTLQLLTLPTIPTGNVMSDAHTPRSQ